MRTIAAVILCLVVNSFSVTMPAMRGLGTISETSFFDLAPTDSTFIAISKSLYIMGGDSLWQKTPLFDSVITNGCIAVCKNTPVMWLISDTTYNLALYRSDDGGHSWVPSDSGIVKSINNIWVNSLFVVEDSVLVMTTDGFLYRSFDRGQFWKSSQRRFLSNVTAIGSHLFGIKNIGLLSAYIIHSSDLGETWDTISTNLPYSDIANSRLRPWIISCGSRLYISEGTEGRPGKAPYTYVSEDSGKTWTTYDASRYLNSICRSGDTVFAAFSDGVHYSFDGGSSWSLCATPLSAYSDSIPSLKLTYKNGVLYASTKVGVFRSVDCGSSWSSMNNGLSERNGVTQIHKLGNALWCIGNGVLYKSENSGNDWQSIAPDGLVGAPSAFAFRDSMFVVGSSMGGFAKSLDSGKTWSSSSPYSTAFSVSIVAMTQNSFLTYAPGQHIKKSTDGISWVDCSDATMSSTNLCSIYTLGENVYAPAADKKLYLSMSDGDYWEDSYLFGARSIWDVRSDTLVFASDYYSLGWSIGTSLQWTGGYFYDFDNQYLEVYPVSEFFVDSTQFFVDSLGGVGRIVADGAYKYFDRNTGTSVYPLSQINSYAVSNGYVFLATNDHGLYAIPVPEAGATSLKKSAASISPLSAVFIGRKCHVRVGAVRESGEMKLYNLAGSCVSRFTVSPVNGVASLAIPKEIASGTYCYSFTISGSTINNRVILP